MITIKKIANYKDGPVLDECIIDSRPDAQGIQHPFSSLDDAFIYAEHHLYAYNVYCDGVVVPHEEGQSIVKRLKEEKKICYY